MKHLVIRADASTQMGSGHVMRCLALADAWRDLGGQVTFLTAARNPALHQRIKSAGAGMVVLTASHPDPADLQITLNTLARSRADWLVLDGYHFDPSYQGAIRAAGHRLMVVDDTAQWPFYDVDVVLNQNIHARPEGYRCSSGCQLWLGSRYVLLRPEFLRWRVWERPVPAVAHRLLVTMGGSDPVNLTGEVVKAVSGLCTKGVEVEAVVGPEYPFRAELERLALPGLRVLVNVQDMAERMESADLAIAAAGSTAWELAFMGLPALLVSWAENQRPIAAGLAAAGVAEDLGWYREVPPLRIAERTDRLVRDAKERLRMSRAGRRLVDGKGASRVAEDLYHWDQAKEG